MEAEQTQEQEQAYTESHTTFVDNYRYMEAEQACEQACEQEQEQEQTHEQKLNWQAVATNSQLEGISSFVGRYAGHPSSDYRCRRHTERGHGKCRHYSSISSN